MIEKVLTSNNQILELGNNGLSDNLQKIYPKLVSTLKSSLPINGLDLNDLYKIEDKIDEYGNLLIKLCYTKCKVYKNRIMVILNGQDDFFKDPDGDIMFHAFDNVTPSIVNIEKVISKKKEEPNLYGECESYRERYFSGLYDIQKNEKIKDENGNSISIFYDFSPNNDKSQMNYRIDKNDKYRKLIANIEKGIVIPWKDQDGKTDFYTHSIEDGYHFIRDEEYSDGIKIILPGDTQYYNNGQQFISPQLKGGCVYIWDTKEVFQKRLHLKIWGNMSKIEQDAFIRENKSVIVPGLDAHLSLTDIIIEGDLNIMGNSSKYIVYLKEGQLNVYNITTRKSDLELSDTDYNKNHILVGTPLVNKRTAFYIQDKSTNTYKLLYYSPKKQSYIFSNNPKETSRSVVVERAVSRFEGIDDLIRTATIYESHFLLDDNTERVVER